MIIKNWFYYQVLYNMFNILYIFNLNMESIATRNIMDWLKRIRQENKSFIIKNGKTPSAFLIPFSYDLLEKLQSDFKKENDLASEMKSYYEDIDNFDKDWKNLDLDFKI